MPNEDAIQIVGTEVLAPVRRARLTKLCEGNETDIGIGWRQGITELGNVCAALIQQGRTFIYETVHDTCIVTVENTPFLPGVTYILYRV